MKQVTVIGLFCLLAILVTQNGCTKKEPPSAGIETTNETSSESRQPEQGKVITNSIGMKLVYIPAGSFVMGSGDSAAQLAREYKTKEEYFRREFPQHEVRISEGLWIGQTEVTQGQYMSVMNARPWSGKLAVQEGANNPAVYVSWEDAVAFCSKLSQREGKTYRLPTEAEWEYACRAGKTTRFSFGDDDSSLGDYAWFCDNALNVNELYAHAVRQKRPNLWGLYDMHGNVWEWCSDWYGEDYYSNSPSADPPGPPSGGARHLRGGSWVNTGGALRCSCRNCVNPGDRVNDVGFRVVRSQS
ncbi:MAG: formylglycine-generating enzyme family protein [Planctomycetota bacterium]|jgi:formylglycine-generating enzyme required for sulfatase activity